MGIIALGAILSDVLIQGSGKGYAENFFKTYMGVGWLDFSQKPSFSFRKSICKTDRFVVLIFSQLFFWREKIRRPNTRLRQNETLGVQIQDCVKMKHHVSN